MKTLVLGASGTTGRLVVSQLIIMGISPKIIIRSTALMPKEIIENKSIEIIIGNIDEYSVDQFKIVLKDCDSIISCLGHNISFKGIMGKPKKLVYNATNKIVEALIESNTKKKFILMSTTAFTIKIIGENDSFGESLIFGLLKLLLPPHTDNIASGDYLFSKIKEADKFEWVAVRPDTLIDETVVTEYEAVNTRKRSPIFDPGKASRINVAHFMANLLSNDKLWKDWKFKAPVIYNKE